MKQYLVIIEKENENYGAYVPDLPGCVAVGETQEEVSDLIKEAIEMHLAAMKEDNEAIPEPKSIPLQVMID